MQYISSSISSRTHAHQQDKWCLHYVHQHEEAYVKTDMCLSSAQNRQSSARSQPHKYPRHQAMLQSPETMESLAEQQHKSSARRQDGYSTAARPRDSPRIVDGSRVVCRPRVSVGTDERACLHRSLDHLRIEPQFRNRFTATADWIKKRGKGYTQDTHTHKDTHGKGEKRGVPPHPQTTTDINSNTADIPRIYRA